MSAHAHGQGEQSLIHINGDMRWVVSSEDPLSNLSASLVEGYNGGSLDFMWHNHLHSLGGYGLWRRHFDLIRFHGGDQVGKRWQPTDKTRRIIPIQTGRYVFCTWQGPLVCGSFGVARIHSGDQFCLPRVGSDKRQWTKASCGCAISKSGEATIYPLAG